MAREQQLVRCVDYVMKKVLQLVCFIYISCFSLRALAESCDVSNILLQPGGLYSLWSKGCYEYDDACDRLYLRKHWQTQLLVYGCEATDGFDDSHNQRPLGSIIFGKNEFQVKDVFLASKLSLDDNLFLPGMASFGSERDEQYLSLLASTKVRIEAEERELGFNTSSIYLFQLPRTCYAIGALGFQLPVRHKRHCMTLDFEDGTLFGAETIPVGGMLEESTLKQFFRDFQGLEDFFRRGVLGPKGLTFLKRQYKTGLGDISLFGLIDFGLYFDTVEALQVGMNVIFPTGNKRTGSKVWEVELGNGGAYQFEPFINMYFCYRRAINPMVYVGVRFSKDFTALRRIPQLIVNADNNAAIADTPVIIPSRFSSHSVREFSENNSSVLYFADRARAVTVSRGEEYFARIGNYIYDIMQCGFYLGVFYDVHVKRKDSLSFKDSKNFNVKLFEETSAKTAHKISWSIAYAHSNKTELYIGSQHVVAGKNVPQQHKVFASIAWFF